MISNEKPIRRTIGIDQSAAIRELENDLQMLKNDVDQKRQAEEALKKEEKLYKKRWNEENKKRGKLLQTIETAEATIEEINDEDDGNEDVPMSLSKSLPTTSVLPSLLSLTDAPKWSPGLKPSRVWPSCFHVEPTRA